MTSWTARREEWNPGSDDARSAFEIDYGRVIHSASFRRLQGKTQILNLGDSDFYRTRLTHSMEVSQVSYGIVQQLEKYDEVKNHLPTQSLAQTIGLVHDLGHPPFGHGGEIALNYCMREHGGFEGNGQTLRVLSRLEKFSNSAGSNLTRRALLGTLKYPIGYKDAYNPIFVPAKSPSVTDISLLEREGCKPPKCYMDSEQEVVDWILEELEPEDRETFTSIRQKKGKHSKSKYKSLDCSIMDIADDISYGVHDLEDAISLRLVDREIFSEKIKAEDCGIYLQYLRDKYPDEFKHNTAYETFVEKLFSKDGALRKRQIGRLVYFFISHIEYKDYEALFQEPLLRYNAALPVPVANFVKKLMQFVFDAVINSPAVQHLEFKGQQMVVQVFDIIAHEPKRFLMPSTLDLYDAAEKRKNDSGQRVICDHISGMTDNYLLRFYERLLSPRMGSIFDKL